MSFSPEDLQRKSEDLLAKWQACAGQADSDLFVEFAVVVSSFTAYLEAKSLSGLHQTAHALEKNVLTLFESWGALGDQKNQAAALHRQVTEFCRRISAFVAGQSPAHPERRTASEREAAGELLPPKRICLVTAAAQEWQDMVAQAACFNIHLEIRAPGAAFPDAAEPVVVMVDALALDQPTFIAQIESLRARFSASKIMGLNALAEFDAMKSSLAAGCDFCYVAGTTKAALMSRIVKLCANDDEPAYRVLVVEDSKTASKHIQRTLAESGIESLAIARPQEVLTSLVSFKPDLVLMDMFMPGCTGVEVTRVIRQYPEFLSTPVVYLSGDNDVALQVDALRLGGDHFLTKPFNPVVLNAVVTSKIERYRALRRSMYLDSLTGLLNHTAAKERLDSAVAMARAQGSPLCMAMIDIDHFKKVNDTYGHPAGDQVIRSLAWLLKLRLRKTDAVGRYGGEEFLVVLPGLNAAQARKVLDGIRLDFAEFQHPLNDGWMSCSFSGGIAELSGDQSAEALVQSADEGLYAAKRGGRNQIEVR